MPSEGTDTIFAMLAHEHRDLEAQFAALHEQAAQDFVAACEAYPALAAAIVTHLHAEAEVLFPRLSSIEDLDPLLARSRADHARIEADAMYLARAQLTPSEWLRALRRLESDVEHLIEREEAHVFPVARRALPPDQSHALGGELLAHERESAPT